MDGNSDVVLLGYFVLVLNAVFIAWIDISLISCLSVLLKKSYISCAPINPRLFFDSQYIEFILCMSRYEQLTFRQYGLKFLNTHALQLPSGLFVGTALKLLLNQFVFSWNVIGSPFGFSLILKEYSQPFKC